MNILLVEDHEACAEGFLCLMEEYIPGAYIQHARSLEEAAIFVNALGPFDIIVLDLSLPDAKATISVRLLIQLTPETPIVVYTAYPQFEEACINLGVNAYMIKASINGDELAETIQRIVRGG